MYIADGRPRTVTFTPNPNGQVLSRIESSAAAKNPEDYYYFVDGAQVGELTSLEHDRASVNRMGIPKAAKF